MIPLKFDTNSEETINKLKSIDSQLSALKKKQWDEEKQFGANVGALKARHLKEVSDLETKMAAQKKQLLDKQFNDEKTYADKVSSYLQNVRVRSTQLAEKELDKQSSDFQKMIDKFTTLHAKHSNQVEKDNEKITTSHQRELDKQAKAAEAHALKLLKYHNMLVKNSLAQGDNQRGLREMIGAGISQHSGRQALQNTLAFVGAGFSLAEIQNLGKEAVKVDNQMEGAFRTAGATAQQASLYAKQTAADYGEIGIKLGVTETAYKELARTAAFTGGFLGDMNKQLIVAAAAIEKQTAGNEGGEVTAARFIKGISMGVTSEEGSNVIGQLRRSMPLLAAELAKATDKEDLFRIAIKYANESVKAQTDFINSEAGAVERNNVLMENNFAKLGKSLNNTMGSMINGLENFAIAFDRAFNIVEGAEETTRVIQKLKAEIIALEKIDKENQTDSSGLIGVKKEKIKQYEAELEAIKKASDEEAKNNKATKDGIPIVNEAAQQIGILADEYNRVKDALAKLDTSRTRENFLINQAALAEQDLANGNGTVWSKYFIEETDKQIAIEDAKTKQFNKFHARHDPDKGTEKGVTKSDLENPLKAEQTRFELSGIRMQYTKEQIEIGLLQIQIKYDDKIAEHAKKNSNTQVEFALQAAHARERIIEIEAAEELKILERRNKSFELDYKFQLDSADQFEKKRLQLLHDFDLAAEGLNSEQSEKINAQLTKDLKENEDARADALIKKRVELTKRLLEAQAKGIELQIKQDKDNTDLTVAEENDLYKKKAEIIQNNYDEAVRLAKGNAELLHIIEMEFTQDSENGWIAHLNNLASLTKDKTSDIEKDFKSAAKGAMSSMTNSLFKPLEDELKIQNNPLATFAIDLAKKLANTGIDKLVEGVFEKKEDAKTISTPKVDLRADIVNLNGQQKSFGVLASDQNPEKSNTTVGTGGTFDFSSKEAFEKSQAEWLKKQGYDEVKKSQMEASLHPGLVFDEDPDKGTLRGKKNYAPKNPLEGYDPNKRNPGDPELKVDTDPRTNGTNAKQLEVLGKVFEGVIDDAIDHVTGVHMTGAALENKTVADLAPGQTTMSQKTMQSIMSGSFNKNFDTSLSPDKEKEYQKWKAKYAPNDSGSDYDLRGAFNEGMTPGQNGHWSDKYKKPNHPTFSNESQYARFGDAGSWDGDIYKPSAIGGRRAALMNHEGDSKDDKQSQAQQTGVTIAQTLLKTAGSAKKGGGLTAGMAISGIGSILSAIPGLGIFGSILGAAGGLFADGGYTGGKPGEVRGIVHGDEHVFTSPQLNSLFARMQSINNSGGGNIEKMIAKLNQPQVFVMQTDTHGIYLSSKRTIATNRVRAIG